MRRGAAALSVLLLLLSLAALNVRHLDALTEELYAELALSKEAWEDEDYPAAEAHLLRAEAKWERNEAYTHVFIRHEEVSAVYDAFFALLGDLRAGDAGAAEGDFRALLCRLESIRSMEHPRFSSVF